MPTRTNLFIRCTLFLCIAILYSCKTDADMSRTDNIRAISYNIKYDNKADTVNGWDQRKARVTNLVQFYKPDFLGTQEALLHQLQYMEANLDSMKWIGVGRADGRNAGEFSALFYNARRIELVSGSDSTAWLSETPGEPGKSWDAALPRIVTWGAFRDRQSGDTLYVFNTHFDHLGDTARAESARLILDIMDRTAAGKPVVLMGDFNATPGSRPYRILTGDASPLSDAYLESAAPHVGPAFSFEGFEVMSDNPRRRIDYIFVNDGVDVLQHAIISDFRDGRYPSDHLPVLADIRVRDIPSP